VVLVLAPALAAAQAEERTLTYTCDTGEDLVVTYTDEAAKITVPDGDPIELKQRTAADGFRYADKSRTLRGTGRELTYTAGTHKSPVKCHVSNDSPPP
jgi:membrane-bound inhibitor of C-type lysozyme